MSTVVETATRGSRRNAQQAKRQFLCKHCGTPSPLEDFCCSGCAYVYRLLHEQGFDAYYRLKDKITPPADTALLPARDYSWLIAAQAEAERVAAGRTPELYLDVQGVSCAGCVWLIERLFTKQRGAGQIDVNAQTGQLRLAWVSGEFCAATFARTLQSFNYLVAPASAQRSAHPESRELVKRIGLCTAFAMNVMLFTLPTYFGMEPTAEHARLFSTLSMGFATLSLLAGGAYFLNRALRSLFTGVMNIDLPIAIGIVGAYAGSLFGWLSEVESFVYFDFVSAFILLMLVGRWAQVAAVERNQRRLLAQQPAPSSIRVWDEQGNVMERRPESLQAREMFAVAAGQTVPAEALLLSGAATFSLAWINGEAEPRTFRAGQIVPAGAINITRGDLRLQSTQPWSHSLLAQLLRPANRAKYRHRFIERVISGYLVGIIVVATLTGLGWWLRTHDALRTWSVVTAVLVVSCPCAIGLAFPLADEIATVLLRKRGVFVRTEDLWPRLSKVRQIAFDKTGTLTLETPCLASPQNILGLSGTVRSALFALVCDNPHPIGRCLHEQLLAGSNPDPMPGELEEEIGQGVVLKTATSTWKLGRPEWALGGKADASRDPTSAPDTLLTCDNVEIARFSFTEEPRADAYDEVVSLQERNFTVAILSGDRREKVAALARKLGLADTSAHGELRPCDKAAWVGANGPDTTLMLGDGANDSLAFDQALCRGTPVVHRGILEQKADFYYLGHGIAGIRVLFEVNDARRRTHAWLLGFSVTYNSLAVSLAVAGQMSPLLAAILMPISSLLTLAIVGRGMRRAGGAR